AGIAKALGASDYRTFAERMINSMFTPETDPALRERIRTTMLAAPQHVMVSAIEGMAAIPPVTEDYSQVPVVALMTKRGNGAVYRDFLKQHFQLVDFREFEGAGHFLMMEQGASFNDALRYFFDSKCVSSTRP